MLPPTSFEKLARYRPISNLQLDEWLSGGVVLPEDKAVSTLLRLWRVTLLRFVTASASFSFGAERVIVELTSSGHHNRMPRSPSYIIQNM